MSTWVEIDGARGEGGGQIVRTSLTLSLLTGKPVKLTHIRAGRAKPGLQPQHLMSLRAAATIGQAKVTGDEQGSRAFTFEPEAVVAGKYTFAIGTAGATGLVLQTIALPLALRGVGPSEVIITGGTHVKASPCFHFLETTWRAYLELLGLDLKLKLRRCGFYPRGGGVVEARIAPTQLKPLNLDRKSAAPAHIAGFSAVAGLPESIAERQRDRALTRLRKTRLPCAIALETWEGGPGTVLGLVLHGPPAPTFFFGLGERGRPAERVADEAVDALLDHLASAATAVDPHSADQLVLPLALAPGRSVITTSRVTQHLLTNVAVIEQFLERKISVNGAEGRVGHIVIE